MIPLLSAFLAAFTAACKAYVARLEWEKLTHKETTLNALEDEMDVLAADGSPAAKLRMERLAIRRDRLCQPQRPL